MNWLFNKKVLITGASSGIGKEITKILINKYNCHVLGVNRSEDKLIAFKQELADKQDNFDYYPMDASKLENWQSLYQKLVDNNQTIDILINNAGMMHPFMRFDKIDFDQINKVIDINFYSAVYSTKIFMPMLLKSESGAIVNISSASALCNIPGVSIYSASKSALRAFSETISYEYRKQLYISTVMPGFAKTNLFYSKDNSKQIVAEKDDNLISKFCMPVEKMARKIVGKLKRKRRRVVVGLDAKFVNFMHKLMPQTTTKLVGGVFKATKLDTFQDIFEQKQPKEKK